MTNQREEVSYSFNAMGVTLPDWTDHPNRIPFSGVMTKLDEPSTYPVGGAKGKKVVFPSAVAEAALPSLIGMSVDFKPKFDGHDSRNKIGLITHAEVRGSDLWIAGFLYGADFPKEVDEIKALKDQLGFSYEGKCSVADWDSDPVEVAECVFTGAAILFKDLAAYTTTSLEASASTKEINEVTLEELKAALAEQMAPLNDRLAKLEASAESLAASAATVVDKVKPHSDALRACADSMQAAGFGLHADKGHVKILHAMASNMDAEAAHGKFPSVYNDHSWMTASADTSRVEAVAKLTADLAAAKAESANLTNEIVELKAAAFKVAEAPARQLEAGAGDKTEPSDLSARIKANDAKLKAEGKPTNVRLAAAMEMQLIDAAAATA